ncbi:hypothetical protein [Thiomicrorhabdus sediminis]|uniref:Uncharacterized protein n=1 Tax=Thiomicrorhabdus sediminis TaxID=2580412 RepID=A0A4P9K3Y6_9GAMM|nr:hypothetical protein [Thiomicrorhabdus sediminis]QCU89605.1 hypothetical protein FE785_02620 [Thiomicrorhabdus sediminis]
MSHQFKIHLSRLLAIGLIACLLAAQAISVHTHLIDEQHHHGVHIHDVESHHHGWFGHSGIDQLNLSDNQNQAIDIEPVGKLNQHKTVYKKVADLDLLLTTTPVIRLQKTSQPEVVSDFVTPINTRSHFTLQPRAPPVFSLLNV